MFNTSNFERLFKFVIFGFIVFNIIFVLICFGPRKVFDIAVDYFGEEAKQVKEQVYINPE